MRRGSACQVRGMLHEKCHPPPPTVPINRQGLTEIRGVVQGTGRARVSACCTAPRAVLPAQCGAAHPGGGLCGPPAATATSPGPGLSARSGSTRGGEAPWGTRSPVPSSSRLDSEPGRPASAECWWEAGCQAGLLVPSPAVSGSSALPEPQNAALMDAGEQVGALFSGEGTTGGRRVSRLQAGTSQPTDSRGSAQPAPGAAPVSGVRPEKLRACVRDGPAPAPSAGCQQEPSGDMSVKTRVSAGCGSGCPAGPRGSRAPRRPAESLMRRFGAPTSLEVHFVLDRKAFWGVHAPGPCRPPSFTGPLQDSP